jgi:hypothetical protein
VDLEVGAEGKSKRLRARTINVSRGGVLLDVGVKVPSDAPCTVTFVDVGELQQGYRRHAANLRQA